MTLKWSNKTPETLGLYCYKPCTQWCMYLVEIKKGSWQLAQNPEWLYVSGLPKLHEDSSSRVKNGVLELLEQGLWLGPLPEPE